MRGLDYLFGHTQGYGERRIGVDSYGIPIYANKKGGGDALTVEVEPPSVQSLDVYEMRGEQVYSAQSESVSASFILFEFPLRRS